MIEIPKYQTTPPHLMRRVILESPYAGNVSDNIAYARECLRDSLLRCEAPLASHLLYTQTGVLDDDVANERAHGINAGHAWIYQADAVVVYTDLGISGGMKIGIALAEFHRIQIDYRMIRSDAA